MNNSKLDVIVLGVLSVLALALVGAYALVHPNHAIPSDLVALATLVIGGLAGRAMPMLTSSSETTTPAGNELTGVVSALTDTLGAVLATPDTSSDETTATSAPAETTVAPAAAVASAVSVRPVLPTPAPMAVSTPTPAVAPNTVSTQVQAQ